MTTNTTPCQLQPGVYCTTQAPRDVNAMDSVTGAVARIQPEVYIAGAIGLLAIVIFLRVGRSIMRLSNDTLAATVEANAKTKTAAAATIKVGMRVS